MWYEEDIEALRRQLQDVKDQRDQLQYDYDTLRDDFLRVQNLLYDAQQISRRW